MRMEVKLFTVLAMLGTFTSAHAVDICISCEVQGLPTNHSLNEIAKLAKNEKLVKGPGLNVRSVSNVVDPDPTGDYEAFCLGFGQEDPLGMKNMLREMATTSYSVDSYFSHSLCQPAGYSNAVKCPMIHKTADDPQKNERKIQDLADYYTDERKEPGLFTKAINFPSSEGQTLLDYIEHMTTRDGGYSQAELNGPVKRIVALLCKSGGVYKTYKNKACPTK